MQEEIRHLLKSINRNDLVERLLNLKAKNQKLKEIQYARSIRIKQKE